MRRKGGLSFYQRDNRISPKVMKELFEWISGIISVIVLAYLIIITIGIRTSMIGESMEPNIKNGQSVLINKVVYKLLSPKIGDVIVFLPKGNQNTHYYIKRIVARPGDLVVIEEGQLYVNGEQVDQGYDKMQEAGIVDNPLKLNKDEYFVLGDNRNNSEDSRSANIGQVHKDDIFGQAWFRLPCDKGSVGIVK